jgi:hypothetical protein
LQQRQTLVLQLQLKQDRSRPVNPETPNTEGTAQDCNSSSSSMKSTPREKKELTLRMPELRKPVPQNIHAFSTCFTCTNVNILHHLQRRS